MTDEEVANQHAEKIEPAVRALIARWRAARGAERVFIERQLEGWASKNDVAAGLIGYWGYPYL
jgi:hypothetical protein